MKRNKNNITVQNDNSKKAAFGIRAVFLIILIIAALVIAGVIAASFLWQNKTDVPAENEVAGYETQAPVSSDYISWK